MELDSDDAPREPLETAADGRADRAPRATRRRLAWAFAAALIAHGLLALALFKLPTQGRAPGATPARLEIEIRYASKDAASSERPRGEGEAASAPAGARSADTSVASPSAAPLETSRSSVNPGLPRSSSKPADLSARAPADISASETNPAASAAPSQREHDAAWAAAEGLGPARLPASRFGVSRTLQDPLAALGPSPHAGRSGAGSFDNGFGQGPQGPVHQPTREEALAEEKARVEGRVTRWITDDMAIARANRDGDRDGRWQDLQDVLEKGFAPQWSLLDEKPGRRASAPSAVRVIAEQYVKAMDSYGKTGSPVGHEPDSPGVPGASMNNDLASALPSDRGLRGTPMDSQMAQVIQLQNLGGGAASPWLQRLVVHLLLTQRPDGVLEDVSIAGSSGNPIYDALALDHARALSAHGLLTAPPKDHRKTIWAFEADFEQLPPMPVAGCNLDGLAPANCFYPLHKGVKSRVRLEAVY